MKNMTGSRSWIMGIVAAWDVGTVQAVVDIHPGRVYRVERATDSPLILKNIGKDSPPIVARFEFESEVLHHLDRHAISVALPILNQEGELLTVKEGHLYTMSPCLTSNNQWLTLDFEGLKRLNRNCGAAIAKLHTALAAFPTEGLESRTWKTVLPDSFLEHWVPTIQQSIAPQERAEFDAIIAGLSADMRATNAALPMQLIHRDCHHGNIVVNGEQVSGFIDCDHLSLGPRVFDLADFIVHMIKQHVADQKRTAEWFDLFPAVIQGYEEETSLSKEEKQALYHVMLGVLIMLAGWFFAAGRPENAQSELEAIRWMCRHRQPILDRIIAAPVKIFSFRT